MTPERARAPGGEPEAPKTSRTQSPAYQTPVCNATPLAGKPEHVRPILARVLDALGACAQRGER